MVWGYCTCADFPFIDAVAYLAHSQVSPLVTGKVMCCNFLIWPILPAWCNDGDIYYGVLSLQGGVGILTMLRCEDKPQFVPPCLRCASNQALSFARKFSWAGGGGATLFDDGDCYYGVLSPLGDDPKVVSGESGAVTLGALALISTDKRWCQRSC